MRNITCPAKELTSAGQTVARYPAEPSKEEEQMSLHISKKLCARAASRRYSRWSSIKWGRIVKKVRRLQERIAKAVRAQKHRKVRHLQWILTHSYYARLLAVRRITTNKGKRTSGIDGIVWRTSRQKMRGVFQLRRRGYQALPLRRIYIPKKSGKLRPLSIPVFRDRAMQALYALALQPIAETLADPNSHGFRIGRSTADAIGKCFNCLARQCSPQWILEADITACFDSISHEWIMNNIPLDKKMLRAWLEAGYLESGKLYPTLQGTPQGGVISPVIMNMTLDGLEKAVHAVLPTRYSHGRCPAVHVVRYADDFITTSSTKELLENAVLPAVQTFLAQRGLVLSNEKTRIRHIDDGFEFLGFNLRKFNGRLLIRPPKDAVKGITAKVRQIIKNHRGNNTWELITELNPVIRGWANYYRHVCSSTAFRKVDEAIFKNLWNWVRRRHSCKGKKWSRRKYFRRYRNTSWSFFATLKRPDGTKQYRDLHKAGWMKIVRHVPVRAEANPFDASWREYFLKRKSRKYTLCSP
jgi:RNA-directed DNA polymerase